MTHRYFACSLSAIRLRPAPRPSPETPPCSRRRTASPATELRTMTARFAPADIGADISALPAGERQALARLVEAARLMDSLFLRQVWAGNDALLQQLGRDVVSRPPGPERDRRRGAAALLPDQQGPVVTARSQPQPSSPGVPAKPEAANFYPGGRDQGGSPEVARRAVRRRQGAGHRLLHDDPPRAARDVHRRALLHRVPGRAGRRPRRCCARPRR